MTSKREEVLEKALKLIVNDSCYEGSRAIKGNAQLSGAEEFYKGYNSGIDVQFKKTAGIAHKALDWRDV